MYKKRILLFFLFAFSVIKAQELNCSVTVNADQISVSNSQIFKTLENALTEFINETQWTNIEFKEHERIKSSIVLLLTTQNGTNSFSGTLQVQASRPVFNTNYYSPILNYKDDKFSFAYVEFQNLNYNLNSFESNLISVLSYYVHFIIGTYIDTFSVKGGTEYLNTALTIANQAQQSGYDGWGTKKGSITRFTLIDELLSPSNEVYREMIFDYHTKGMDTFERNQRQAVTTISKNILSLKEINRTNPNHLMTRIMMDAKADEIVNIFRGGSFSQTDDVVKVLKKVSSNNSKKWKKIDSF